jgi:hypothetical protein
MNVKPRCLRVCRVMVAELEAVLLTQPVAPWKRVSLSSLSCVLFVTFLQGDGC